MIIMHRINQYIYYDGCWFPILICQSDFTSINMVSGSCHSYCRITAFDLIPFSSGIYIGHKLFDSLKCIDVSLNWGVIGSENGFVPQVITWTNDNYGSSELFRTKFSDIVVTVWCYDILEMHAKVPSTNNFAVLFMYQIGEDVPLWFASVIRHPESTWYGQQLHNAYKVSRETGWYV